MPVAVAKIPPMGGTVTFRISTDAGYFAKSIYGTLVFSDGKGKEYCHNYSWLSSLTDLTIVSPTIVGGCGAADPVVTQYPQQDEKSFSSFTETTVDDSDISDVTEEEKRNTILVVGRFGSGKSTFLNTLAGTHWKYSPSESGEHEFVVNRGVEEKFETSRSAKGCTLAAVASDITTFDGRELTVIDTVGYEDNVNADTFYTTSNLTDVMDKHKEISAVVIVVNSQDPRLTRGFVESLACVPTSFKAKVQKNVVLVFTKWTEDDEDEYCDEPDRGFTEQVKIIRSVLGVDENDEVKTYWMDNRPFKKLEKARFTIDSLTSFLDHVYEMPPLSCPEFKEMRALSQFEREIRKEIKKYFQPSGRSMENPSGFEKFLSKHAIRHKYDISKVSFTSCTAKAWSDKLVGLMQREIVTELPKEIERICHEMDVKLNPKLMPRSDLTLTNGDCIAMALMASGFGSIIGTAFLSFGLSLVALPGCLALAYGHSMTWSRETVIKEVVFAMSEAYAEVLCSQITSQFSSYVDEVAEELQRHFD